MFFEFVWYVLHCNATRKGVHQYVPYHNVFYYTPDIRCIARTWYILLIISVAVFTILYVLGKVHVFLKVRKWKLPTYNNIFPMGISIIPIHTKTTIKNPEVIKMQVQFGSTVLRATYM